MVPRILGASRDNGQLTGRWEVREIGVLEWDGGRSSRVGSSVVDSLDLFFAVTHASQ